MRRLLAILIVIVPMLSMAQQAGNGVVVAIQPFGDIPPSYVTYFYKLASQIIPGINIKATIPLPKSAFYAPRNRYRADSLIDFLERNTPDKHVPLDLPPKIYPVQTPVRQIGVFLDSAIVPGKHVLHPHSASREKTRWTNFLKLLSTSSDILRVSTIALIRHASCKMQKVITLQRRNRVSVKGVKPNS